MMHMGGVQSEPGSMNTMYVQDDFTAENGWVLAPPSLVPPHYHMRTL